MCNTTVLYSIVASAVSLQDQEACDSFAAAVSELTSLESLDVGYCWLVDNNGLARIMVACTQLVQLKTSCAPNRLHTEGI